MPGLGGVPIGPGSGPALLKLLGAQSRGRPDAAPSYGFPRRSGDSPPLKAPHRWAATARTSGPAEVAAAIPDGTHLPGADESDTSVPQLEFDYGDVHLRFPTAWLLSHWAATQDGTAVSQDEVLDILWPDIKAAVAAASLDGSEWCAWFLKHRVGCFNAPRSPDGWSFWSEGEGGHIAWVLTLFRLLGATVSFVDDKSSGTDHGVGFGNFVERAVTGALGFTPGHDPGAGLARRHANHDEFPDEWRGMRFHWRSVDWRYSGAHETDIDSCGEEYVTLDGEHCGAAWDQFLYTVVDECGPRDGTCPYWSYASPNLGCQSNAYARDYTGWEIGHVTFHADQLGFDARAADALLTWARAAVAYYQDSASLAEADARYQSHLLPAYWLGRQVLRRMVGHLRIVIHELGHIYNMRDHCAKACFMDAAAVRYTCLVAGRLGLPWDEERLRFEGLGGVGCYLTSNAFGSEDALNQGADCVLYQSAMCHFVSEGVRDAKTRFCMTTTCDGETMFRDEAFGTDMEWSVALLGCGGITVEPSESVEGQTRCGARLGVFVGDLDLTGMLP